MKRILLIFTIFSFLLVVSNSLIPSVESSLVKEDIKKLNIDFFINNYSKGLRNIIIWIAIFLVEFILNLVLYSLLKVNQIFNIIAEIIFLLDDIINSKLISFLLKIIDKINLIFSFPLQILITIVNNIFYYIIMFLYSILTPIFQTII